LFGFVSDDELGGASFEEVVEYILNEWPTVHPNEHFRIAVGERTESGALAGGEYDCLTRR